MLNHLRTRRRDDTGMAFFLEVLLILAVVGLIVGFTTNSVRGTMQNHRDQAVQQDLRTYAKAAEAYFVRQAAYPTQPTGWDMRGRSPVSEDGKYHVTVHPSGPHAGYVIRGRDPQSTTWTYVLSSYTGGEPVRAAGAATGLPTGVGSPVVLQW